MTGLMRRLLPILVLAFWLLAAFGCKSPPEARENVWEQAKIGDLAAATKEGPAKVKFMAAARMDVHILDLPADNVDKLDKLWEALSAKPVRMNSYNAFTQNGFRVKFGRTENWLQIENLLAEAGAQRAGTTSLILAESEPTDLPVVHFSQDRRISFVSSNLSEEVVNVGPGALVLRLTCQPMPWARGVRKVIAYPSYALPVTSAISELESRIQKHEFPFASAAFATQMGPGDLLVLAPDRYVKERVSLGSLFFNQPGTCMFFNTATRKPPQPKAAVRVLVLLCTCVRS